MRGRNEPPPLLGAICGKLGNEGEQKHAPVLPQGQAGAQTDACQGKGGMGIVPLLGGDGMDCKPEARERNPQGSRRHGQRNPNGPISAERGPTRCGHDVAGAEAENP